MFAQPADLESVGKIGSRMQRNRKWVLIFAMVSFVRTGVPAPATPAPRRIEITASRFAFDPPAVTLKKDETVVLVLKSTDVTHGIRVRDLGLDVKASKDRPGEVSFTPHKAGDFIGSCSVFCGARHGSMKISFHVVN